MKCFWYSPRLFFAFALLLGTNYSNAQSAANDDVPSVLFEGVRVLTMTVDGVLDDVDVLVTGAEIRAVGDETGPPPENTLVIDGRGKVLMPGLADMHVHYLEFTGAVYPANSITTVRNLWGSFEPVRADHEVKAGYVVGPHVVTSGPVMDGPDPVWGSDSVIIATPEQAVGAVEAQRKTGFRAVKLYEGLTPEIYRAAVAAARDRDMQVWSHTPRAMTVDEVLDVGVDSLEHFDNVADVLSDSDAPVRPGSRGYIERWAAAEADRIQAFAERSLVAGVWHSPTLAIIVKRYEYAADPDAFFAMERANIAVGLESNWRRAALRVGPYDDVSRRARANQLALVRALHTAGAPLLLGTDTPNPFVLPGYAIHDELDLYLEAGIPVEEVLAIATREAARFLGEAGEWGVVAVGARADLVLLDADPRSQIETLRRPAGTMVNGHWYDRERLDSEVRRSMELAPAYEPPY